VRRGPRRVPLLLFSLVASSLSAGAEGPALRPFSTAALDEARAAARPLALLVSRRACPRCRALEAAAFSDLQVAAVLAGRFTTLAVDADERPDVAGAFADGLALLPDPRAPPDPGLSLLVVTTPDLRPLEGTSLMREGRPVALSSLVALLVRLADSWDADRSALEVRGGLALAALREAQHPAPPLPALSPSLLERPLAGLREAFDPRHRGFGLPPRRIPHGAFLLLFEEQERRSDPQALALATATLDAILASPLRTPDGGFFREALGADWSRPVEEQTLADNALLLRALVAAHEATGRSSYADAAARLARFLRTGLADERGGFRHAVASGPAGDLRDERVFAFANGLALSALSRSGRVLGRAEDVTAASQAAERVMARLGPAQTLSRFAMGSDRRGPALLVDHAFLAEGMLDLHEATGSPRWRDEARALVDVAIARYGDDGPGFLESADDGEVRPARRRDAYDGPLPSGNAVMVSALRRLGRVTGETLYADLARRTALAFAGDLSRTPRGLESLAAVVGELLGPSASAAAPAAGASTSAGARATRGEVSFEAAIAPTRIRPGGSATVEVRVQVAAGAHVVAHRPFLEGTRPRDAPDLLPLSLAFPGTALKVGAPQYPSGVPVPLPGSAPPVFVHSSGPTVVTARLTPSPLKSGDHGLRVRVSFQACDSRGCSAPDSVILEAPFTVEP
jgi:uncharacterized protein YyaL (SSP411 family)